jgi:hypothetical protein
MGYASMPTKWNAADPVRTVRAEFHIRVGKHGRL